MSSEDAIGALIAFSREASQRDDPAALAGLVADTLQPSVDLVAVFLTGPDGSPSLVELRGATSDQLDEVEFLHTELADEILARCPHLAHRRTHLVLSGRRLFGALVLGFRGVPAAGVDRLGAGVAEVAGLALERTHDLRELQTTITALRRSREQLARTESLRQLGQMAAVVAHEVKNPIASISGVLQVLRDRSQGHDRAIMEKVLGRLDDMNELVQELLTFARPRTPVRQPIDLHALVVDCADAAQRSDSGVAVEIEGHSCEVDADPAMLRQVFLNLVLNAAQAMDGQGVVHIGCERVGAQVYVRIDDEGPGIPADQRAQVFEPFYTTKTRGTGLGLAVSRRVVEAHGGHLELEEAPTGGARFQVILPVA